MKDLLLKIEAMRAARPWYVKAWGKLTDPFWAIVNYLRYDLPQGIKGLLYWAPFAWKWRSWDFAYGLQALCHHLVKLEVACRTGYHVSGEKDAKEIRVAITLLKRYGQVDQYYKALESPAYQHLKGKPAIRHSTDCEEAEWQYLMKLLTKKMQRWWD